MVCEVDWCRLRAGCGVVDDEFVVVRQFVRDCRVDLSRETFLTIRTHARQFHFVIFYRIIPNFLRNQIQRIAREFSRMIQINERLGFDNFFLTETGTKIISTINEQWNIKRYPNGITLHSTKNLKINRILLLSIFGCKLWCRKIRKYTWRQKILNVYNN